MRFMVIVKANAESEAGQMPSEEVLTAMTEFNERLVAAGVMVDGNGLHPSSRGARVRFDGGDTSVIDGPFTETKELVAGYWILECASLQECVDWIKQVPSDPDVPSELEIRPVFGVEDFGDELTQDLRDREAAMREQSAARHGS